MKIDFSTIFLVIFLILPGLFSSRSQYTVAPRSLEDQGATEELADFVVQGLAVHLAMAFSIALALCIAGRFHYGDFTVYLKSLDASDPHRWVQHHVSEAILLFGMYVLLTFFVGHLFGLFIGVWRLRRPVNSFVWSRFHWFRRLGITGSLGERPIIYEVLNPSLDPEGEFSIVFVEAEMKNSLGFYSGQVSQYAVVKDSEAHKEIYLTEVWFRLLRDEEYLKVEAEGVLIDLADVATLRVNQLAGAELVEDDSSSPVAI